MHRTLAGESLWAFTRRKRDGRYVLAAELVVARKGVIREGDFAEKYGPYRLSGDPARSRLFDVDRGEDAEPTIRGLSIAPKAKHLGQSFQGRSAVRPIETADDAAIRGFAARQPVRSLLTAGISAASQPESDRSRSSPVRRPSAVTDPAAVLAAMAEFDRLGKAGFLALHHFGPETRHALYHEGRLYTPKAILGVAWGYEHGGTPLSHDEFSGGPETNGRLGALGFRVVPREEAPPENVTDAARDLDRKGTFDPGDETDTRRRVAASIALRQGQPRFRAELIAAYSGRCAITGCAVEEVLEAAHIRPYKGEHTNDVRNGLLLRADLHTLFDRRLVAIDDAYRARLSPALAASRAYAKLHGRRIGLPAERAKWPDLLALAWHREEATGSWAAAGRQGCQSAENARFL